jgi:hypothetical protein
MKLPQSSTLIRVGALGVILGELIALASQFDVGATGFVVFIFAGGGLTAIGAALALLGVLRNSSSSAS